MLKQNEQFEQMIKLIDVTVDKYNQIEVEWLNYRQWRKMKQSEWTDSEFVLSFVSCLRKVKKK